MKLSNLFYLVTLSFVIFTSCSESRSRNYLSKEIEHILSSKIGPSEELIASDGSDFSEKFADKEFRIIHYIDSTDCNECALKSLHYWRSSMEDSVFADVGFFFVTWSNSSERSREALKNIGFTHTVYFDSAGLFLKNNPFLNNKMFNTVLVGSNDSILLVGDFRGNDRLDATYRERINVE